MKCYLLQNNDGTVQFMKPARLPDGSYPAPEELLAKWHPTLRDAVKSWREINPAMIPKDRSFRNAWRDGAKTIGVDMPHARDIHRERLREMRAPKLAALDIDSMRAVVAKDDKKTAEVEAKKQALRDVTADPAIEAAKTPEALMAAIPDALK